MTEQLISFETAKLAKEKGFDELTSWYYYPSAYRKNIIPRLIADGANNDINTTYYDGDSKGNSLNLCRINSHPSVSFFSAPTQSLLQKWLREKYDIEINITRMPPEAIKSSFNKGNKRIKKYNMWVWNLNGNPRIENSSLFFDNYEEALEAGLQEALKLI